MKYVLIIGLLLSLSSLKAQQYEAEAFQDTYNDLEDFNSVLLNTDGSIFWEKRFDLNFDFPYYGNTYDHIHCFYEGACYFDGTNGYTMTLALFGYETDIARAPDNISSDVRYKLTTRNEKKCLVLQLTKLRLISDPSVEEFDSHIDMQYWFYEDGTIEIRFGHSNLDNSPVYVPGDGFYLITVNQGPVPVRVHVDLRDPNNIEDNFIAYGDSTSHEDYYTSIVEDRLGLKWWPPEGWVIRFTRTGVNNEEIEKQDQWRVYAQNKQLVLDGSEAAMSVSADFRLYNSLGQPVVQDDLPLGIKQHTVDIKHLPQGIYFYELTSEQGDYQSGRLFVGE